MNGRRAARLLCVIVSNGFIFRWGLRIAWSHTDALATVILGILLCGASIAGIVFELGKRKIALLVNVGIPAILTALMVSSVLWLPLVAKLQHSEYPGEAVEGAVFLALLAGYPFCLAIVTLMAYWLIEIEPNSTVRGLDLK